MLTDLLGVVATLQYKRYEILFGLNYLLNYYIYYYTRVVHFVFILSY